MKLWMVIVGAILLVLGGVLALIVGINWSAKDMSEIADDYKDGDFKSYDEGDTIIIEGEITGEEKDDVFGQTMYIYELDNEDEMGIISGSDLGNKGDDICVKVQVVNMGFDGEKFELLEAKESLGTAPIFYIGIVLAIIGLILLIIGFILKGKKAKEAAATPPDGPAPGMPGEPAPPAPGSYESLYGSPPPAGHDPVQAPPPQQQQPGYGAPPRQPDEF